VAKFFQHLLSLLYQPCKFIAIIRIWNKTYHKKNLKNGHKHLFLFLPHLVTLLICFLLFFVSSLLVVYSLILCCLMHACITMLLLLLLLLSLSLLLKQAYFFLSCLYIISWKQLLKKYIYRFMNILLYLVQ
jgi:hypothetical protein